MDLLLDVNIVIDICQPRPEFIRPALKALSRCHAEGGRIWLYAGAVQTLEYTLLKGLMTDAAAAGCPLTAGQARYKACLLLKSFCLDKSWLAALAGEGDVFDADDPEDQQLLRAVDRFREGEITLLTRDRELLKRGDDRVLSPQQYCQRPAGKPKIDFIDLKAQQDVIRPGLESAVHRVFHHGQYIMGPEIAELERQLAAYVGCRHAVGCGSGTDALLMALMVYGIGPGDAVITSPFTFVATAEAIALLGARPVFVDVDPATFNLDVPKLSECIDAWPADGPRLRGVIGVDLFGLPADYDGINRIARRRGLFVIQDAAQSFGGQYRGRMAGALADIGCTSFFPAKPLGGYGDGGMCFTDNDQTAEVLRSIRVHGQGGDRYDNVRIGINGRLDSLQAAVLLAKFAVFADEIQRRQMAAEGYDRLLASSALKTPSVPEDCRSAWAQYSVLAESEARRAALQARMKSAGVPTAIYYPKPLHLQTAFASLGYRPGAFPVSEDLAGRIFSLPMHPYLTPADQARIVAPLLGEKTDQK